MQQHKIEREQGWSVVRLCSGHFPPPPHSNQALSHTLFIIRDSEEKKDFSLDQTNLGPRNPKAYNRGTNPSSWSTAFTASMAT